MKSIINIILFKIILVTFSNAQTNVEVSKHSANIGETFITIINVKPNGASIGAFTFSIMYDETLIEIQDVQQGNSLSGFYNDSTTGAVFFTGINAEGAKNDFVALSITFEVISAAKLFSNLEIDVEQLADKNGSKLNCSKTGGLLNLNGANCVNNLFVGNANGSSIIIEEGIYQATECIESNGTIITQTPDEIVFKAGEKINLLPAFEVRKQTSFSILIEGCVVE